MDSFRKGDNVEVCSKEEGFLGSYYEATILSQTGNDSYSIRYKNLVTEEDETKPLVETVNGDVLRPLPRKFKNPFGYYTYRELVDVFHNDGWWVGEISAKKTSKKYRVYFETSGESRTYDVSALRSHVDWTDGHWTHSFYKKSAI